MKWLNIITLLLVIVGGLNWGAVALGGHEADLVAALFGVGTEAARDRLRRAAARAGIKEALLAQVLLLVQSD